MNPYEIIGTISQAGQAAHDMVSSTGGWLTAGLICSTTVNSVILAAVLLGAVWLVKPSTPGGCRMFCRNRSDS